MSEQESRSAYIERPIDSDWGNWIEEFAQVGAWMYLPMTNQSWWSEGVYNIYGLKRNEVKEPPALADFFLEGSDKEIENATILALSVGTPWRIKAPFRNAQGELRCVLTFGKTLVKNGELILAGCFQDITEFEKLTINSEHQNRFFQTVLNNLPHMVFVKDAEDLRFVHFNKAGEQLLGLKNSQLIGKNDHDFFPKEQADLFVTKDQAVLESRTTLTIPEENLHTATGTRTLRTKKVGIYDDLGRPTHLLGISEDITDALIQQQTFERQKQAVIQSSRLSSLGTMAGGIAHEINNPLGVMLLAAEQATVCLVRENPDVERALSLLTKVTKTIDRISSIVKSLRVISRDGTDDAFELTKLSIIIQDTLALCSEKFRLNDIKLAVDSSEDGLELQCQRVSISQILINLLSNSFDAVNANGGPGQVSLKTRFEDGFIKIVVKDNGPGITKEQESSIMLPFFTTKAVGIGTGLGLSISKSIAERHGGSLQFLAEESTNGAVFELTLPQFQLVKKAG